MQGCQTFLRVVGAVHDWIPGENFRVGVGRTLGELLDHSALCGFVLHVGVGADAPDLSLVVLTQQKQSLVGLAVERVLLHQRTQACNRRRIGLPKVVKPSNSEFAIRQHFLHLQQALLSLGYQLAVGELQDQIPVLILGALGVRVVAVRLFHLLILDVGNLQLRLSRFRHVGKERDVSRFRHVGKERDEVLVFLFGLRQGGRAAFGVPGIAYRQLGASDEFGIRISIDQSLQRDSGHVEAVMPHRVHGLVKQDLVRLLGPDIRQRINRLFVGTSGCDQQQRAQHRNE